MKKEATVNRRAFVSTLAPINTMFGKRYSVYWKVAWLSAPCRSRFGCSTLRHKH